MRPADGYAARPSRSTVAETSTDELIRLMVGREVHIKRDDRHPQNPYRRGLTQ